MYSSNGTTISTAVLGVFMISLLVVASLAMGSVAASPASTSTTPSLAGDNVQQLDETQQWCLTMLSQGKNTQLPDDVACSAFNEISPHQQIGLDYSVENYGKYQYVVLTMQSNASQPAKANITIEKNGEVIASYEQADETYAFVQERHYNILTTEYNSIEDAQDSGVSRPTITTLQSEYTTDQIQTILGANLSQKEVQNLRLYELQLSESGSIKSVMTEYEYTESDFNGQTEEFDYTISVQVNSRGANVAETQFTVSRVIQRSVLNEEVPGLGENDGTNTTSPSSNTQISQVIQDGFDVVLNDTVLSDVSRYSDGTSRITALQNPRVPPNSGGSNAAVGQANNMSNLRESSTQFPAVVFGDNSEDMLHIGTAYYGVPEAENHYLILTYGLHGEIDTEAEVQIVDRQGNIIDKDGASQNPRPFIIQDTMNNSLNLRDGEQFQQAIDKNTTNTKQVVIRLTDEEVEYINNNYEAFVTYRTDGGEDTLLLYEAQIASTDVVRESTKLPENVTTNESQYEEDPATFDITYRMPYSMNAQYQQIDVLPGETFKIPVTIRNRGDTRVERTVGLHDEFSENNMNYSTIVSEREVMVPPQSEKTIFLEYKWEDYQHGNHTVTLYDTTNDTNWESVSSQEGADQYEVYVFQPPTFEVVGMNTPDSWLRYDHFQTLVAVQNVGDLDTSYLPEGERPYIQGKFGPWQGQITGYVSGGSVRAGEGGGTVNMYFQRNIDYTPNYPNPNQTYSEDKWRQNAPYHTELSAAENKNGEKKGNFSLTVEAVHPWAVIDGTNTITDTPHKNYVEYEQLSAPQENSNGEIVQKLFNPGEGPFVDYTQSQEREQRDMFIYQNELRNCHLAGNHTNYTDDVSTDWNETEVVDNCRGMMQNDVRIYELGISTLRMRNKNDKMVERQWNDDWEKETPNPGLYYASPWPYTETDPSTANVPNTHQNIQSENLKDHYTDISGWSVDGYAAATRLDTGEINTLLAKYENGEITYDQLNKRLLTEQQYTEWKNGNAQPAFNDRQLDRVTSCDGSTTSQLENTGTPPDCPGFGLQSQQMPTTAVENIHPMVETTEGHKFYVDVHIVNNGTASFGHARIKIITNDTDGGINNTSVIGYAVAEVPPNTDKIFRVPVVIPNEPGADQPSANGHHDVQVRVRTEPDYTSYRVSGWDQDKASGRFGVDLYVETWEDFVFENVSTTSDQYKDINQLCDGIGTGECSNQGEQTIFTEWKYTNYGGEPGNHTINGTYGFWKTPTGDGSDWPTLHHEQKTKYSDEKVFGFEDDQWLSNAPASGNWVAGDSSLQKNPEQRYGVNETERWVLQNQVSEPGIYRVYVTQERLNNEDANGTLSQYENGTWSMWGSGSDYTGVGDRDSVSKYKNESHWVQFQVYDIKDPVSRFYYEAESFPRTHSATAYDDSRNGNVVIWEGGTAHFDGRERLDWTAQEFENGIAQDMNVSSDNVGVDVYEWRFSGGDARIYKQSHDNYGGDSTDGKISRRFNQSGTFDVTLQVWDYPQYTEGGPDSNSNTNQSTQTVEVKEDSTDPSIDVSFDGTNQNYDVNNDVIWSGSPDGRSTEFTEVEFSVTVDDNAIGLECGNRLDDGSTNIDHCGWEKTDGSWYFADNGSVVESATWNSKLYYSNRQNDQDCVTFYGQDFSANENDDQRCVTVEYDTTDPEPRYHSEQTWVWGSYGGTGYPGQTVTWDASNSYDQGDPAVGLHAEPYDHSVSGGWQSGATVSTTYPTDFGNIDRTETETVTVRDWYGNTDQQDADVTVLTDNTDPTHSCDPSNCHNSDSDTGNYQYESTNDGSATATASGSASATTCVTFDENGQKGGVGFSSVDPGSGTVTTFSDDTVTVCITASASASVTADADASCSVSCTTPDQCGQCDSDSCSAEDTHDPNEVSDSESVSTTVTVTDKHGNTDSETISAEAEADADAYATTDYSDSCEKCSADCPPPADPPADPPGGGGPIADPGFGLY